MASATSEPKEFSPELGRSWLAALNSIWGAKYIYMTYTMDIKLNHMKPYYTFIYIYIYITVQGWSQKISAGLVDSTIPPGGSWQWILRGDTPNFNTKLNDGTSNYRSFLEDIPLHLFKKNYSMEDFVRQSNYKWIMLPCHVWLPEGSGDIWCGVDIC